MDILADGAPGLVEAFNLWQQGGTVGVVLLMLWGFRFYLNERDAKNQIVVDKNNDRLDALVANHQNQVQTLTKSFQTQVESLAADTRDQMREMTLALSAVVAEVKELNHKIEGGVRGS